MADTLGTILALTPMAFFCGGVLWASRLDCAEDNNQEEGAGGMTYTKDNVALTLQRKALEAEVARLREALRPFAAKTKTSSLTEEAMIRRARAALAGDAP